MKSIVLPDQDRYTDSAGTLLEGVTIADLLLAHQRFIAEWWGRPLPEKEGR